jgi:hypothetical protein
MELSDVVDYRFLAKIASIQNSNLFADIICSCYQARQRLGED